MLSQNAVTRIQTAFGDQTAAAEFVASLTSHAALSTRTQQFLTVALGSTEAGVEVAAAVVSGATLSQKAAKRIVTALGDSKSADNAGDFTNLQAGDEVINAIQTTDLTKPTQL